MSKFCAPRETISIRPVESKAVERLAQELNVSNIIATILVGRGLTNYDACKSFFRPDISSFHDPFMLHGMERAAQRIRTAIDKNELITIYGDYDVDGVSATALLARILGRLGAHCDWYLPNRLLEGYGLSSEGVDEIVRRGTKLIITVDCGIGAVDEVARANAAGIDVIVSDHHEPHGPLPEAVAVLDPKVDGCGYPCRELAGVGVALKLGQAVVRVMERDDSFWMDYLDLAALGTAADIVPLTEENRTIVALGFERLSRTSNPGLRALMELQGVLGGPVSTREVVFQLAPCINAAGRLGDSVRGLKLLVTDDVVEAHWLARELLDANRERQALDAQVQEEAVSWIREHYDPAHHFGLVAAMPHWHAGVIGIAASRVVETFFRPAFLFSIGSDGMAKGSGRSIPGLHLLDAVSDCADLLEGYGGHAAAAGAKMRVENLDAFRARFNEAVRVRVKPENLVPRIIVDAEVNLGALTKKLYNVIKQMEPFGPGNMRPVLYCSGLRNRYEPRIVGKGHLKLTVTGNGGAMDAIAFNLGDRLEEVRRAQSFALAFALDENEWNGQVKLQMKVKGVQV